MMDKNLIKVECIFDDIQDTLVEAFDVFITIESTPDAEILRYYADCGSDDGDTLLHKEFLFIQGDGTAEAPDPELTETMCRQVLAGYHFAQPCSTLQGQGREVIEQEIKELCGVKDAAGIMKMNVALHDWACHNLQNAMRRTGKLALLIADLIHKRSLAIDALLEWRARGANM